MNLNNIINDSLKSVLEDSEELIEEIIDDLLDVMPEDDRTYKSDEWLKQEQKIVNIITRICGMSVSASILAFREIENNSLKERVNSLETQLNITPDLKLLKNIEVESHRIDK
ncbi:MAG: hypothetical protein WBA84_09860 [Carnobacterium sp.]|uniref:hypothetical protein n=1 Tax=Carnobacterium sp. TaxID=48221 RepID=UPI003C7942FA